MPGPLGTPKQTVLSLRDNVHAIKVTDYKNSVCSFVEHWVLNNKHSHKELFRNKWSHLKRDRENSASMLSFFEQCDFY